MLAELFENVILQQPFRYILNGEFAEWDPAADWKIQVVERHDCERHCSPFYRRQTMIGSLGRLCPTTR